MNNHLLRRIAKTMVLPSLSALVMVPGIAQALPLTFSGTSGNLKAVATFDVVGSDLHITLKNDATDAPSDDSANQLAAVFFDLPDTVSLSRISATIISGAIIQGDQCDISGGPNGDNAANCVPTVTNVGGEFAYALVSGPGSADRGISSSGLGLFAPTDVFPGANLDNPVEPDGSNFLLVSENETSFTGNGGLDKEPLIRGTVEFVLGITGTFNIYTDLAHVGFQYGTASTDTYITGTCTANCTTTPPTPGDQPAPEPGIISLLGAGLLALRARCKTV